MRYQGGKARTAKRIADTIVSMTDEGGIYYEPFLGGASVAVEIAKLKHFSRLRLSDSQPDLIRLWKAGLAGWVPPAEMSRKQYTRLREQDFPSKKRGWAAFAASHSGKYFGGYGVKARSANRNYLEESQRSFLNKVQVLSESNVKISCQDYRDAVPGPGDVMYCDPPYANSEVYAGVSEFDKKRFWEHMRFLGELGVIVFVSEFYAPEDFIRLWSVNRAATLDPSSSKVKTESLYIYMGL